jgi:hypothetical protein
MEDKIKQAGGPMKKKNTLLKKQVCIQLISNDRKWPSTPPSSNKNGRKNSKKAKTDSYKIVIRNNV